MNTVTGIHQIEITSRCNLRCKYCVWPHMPRAKQDMTEEVFHEALEWARYFVNLGTQGHELNLAGIGESTLHPEFCRWAKLARDAVGDKVQLILATNGVNVTEEHAKAMRDVNMRVWVSLHRPEKAKLTVDLLSKYGVLMAPSCDPATAAVDWAGQVKWEVTAPKTSEQCMWLRLRQVMVASDGRILTCCFDGQGTDGVLGTVFEDVASMEVKPYSLCQTCHLFKKEAA